MPQANHSPGGEEALAVSALCPRHPAGATVSRFAGACSLSAALRGRSENGQAWKPEIRYLNKLVDELARGKAMEQVLRTA